MIFQYCAKNILIPQILRGLKHINYFYSCRFLLLITLGNGIWTNDLLR